MQVQDAARIYAEENAAAHQEIVLRGVNGETIPSPE
jgi:hypothetical protein